MTDNMALPPDHGDTVMYIARFSAFFFAALMIGTPIHAASYNPIVLDPSYLHDRWKTSNKGIIKDFSAYRSSFDDLDDDDNFGGADAWGVPE